VVQYKVKEGVINLDSDADDESSNMKMENLDKTLNDNREAINNLDNSEQQMNDNNITTDVNDGDDAEKKVTEEDASNDKKN
jgi:hypothetical protein